MPNVLSIVTYKIFPAKLGGQKGIALFNQYFSKKINLFCFTIKDNDPSCASYKVFNELENHILRYINPDFVHVFVDGRIVEEGGAELAHRLEAEGYESFGTANGRSNGSNS